ncbi:unknow [Vibrio campbellii]|nr:unknow [Vibrio campbellii]
MLITIGSRYPVSDCYQQPIRRLIQLIYRLKEHQEGDNV